MHRQLLGLLALMGAVRMGVWASPPIERLGPDQLHRCGLSDSVSRANVLRYMHGVLTDTATFYVTIRTAAGLTTVTPQQLRVDTNPIVCRRAIDAYHAYYDTKGTRDSAEARTIHTGLVVRAGTTRIILAVDLADPWSGFTFTVFDTTFAVRLHHL